MWASVSRGHDMLASANVRIVTPRRLIGVNTSWTVASQLRLKPLPRSRASLFIASAGGSKTHSCCTCAGRDSRQVVSSALRSSSDSSETCHMMRRREACFWLFIKAVAWTASNPSTSDCNDEFVEISNGRWTGSIAQ